MRLETVYAQPSLNWTATQDYGKYIRHSKGEGEAVSQTYRYIDALMAPVGDGLVEHLPWLGAHNAEALDMEEQHVIVLLNRGSTQQLFRNRYLEARLSELGLREDTAFGCAMEFLFRRAPCRSGGAQLPWRRSALGGTRRRPEQGPTGALWLRAGRCRRWRRSCRASSAPSRTQSARRHGCRRPAPGRMQRPGQAARRQGWAAS